jgi:lysophospholipase L1-like esterase
MTGLITLAAQARPAAAANDPIIVSIGDSIASGEGAPDSGNPFARWTGWNGGPGFSDPGTCHRSNNSGPALAFSQRIQPTFPNATFVSVACSGAGIYNGIADIQWDGASIKVPISQMDQVKNWMAANRPGRRIDALFLSVGANDIDFAGAVSRCITDSHCENNPIFVDTVTSNLNALGAKYDSLALGIQQNLNPVKVYITDYHDPLRKDAATFCNAEPFGDALAGVTGDEAQFASQFIVSRLNTEVAQAAQRNARFGWQPVTGMAQQFVGHAYCSGNARFVNTANDSLLTQGDPFGMVHPNRSGYQLFANALGNAFGSQQQTLSPTFLTYRNPAYNSVQLLWGDHSNGETRYEVQVSASAGWTVTVTLPADTTSWQHDGLASGYSYSYQVRACNAGGCAPFSNQVTYTVPAPPSPVPTAPSGLHDTVTFVGEVEHHTLSWRLTSTNQTSVVVKYQLDGTSTWNTVTLGATATSYGLGPAFKVGNTYNFYVQACNSYGCSAPSNTISVLL